MYYIYTNLEWLFKNSLFKKKRCNQVTKQQSNCLGNGKKTLKKCTHQKKKLNLMPFFALERLNCCTQEEKGKHQVKKLKKYIYINWSKWTKKLNWWGVNILTLDVNANSIHLGILYPFLWQNELHLTYRNCTSYLRSKL